MEIQHQLPEKYEESELSWEEKKQAMVLIEEPFKIFLKNGVVSMKNKINRKSLITHFRRV